MQINEKQLELVNDRLQAILKSDNYFANMYREMGITEIKTREDFQRLPFIDKAELRNAYPLGIQAAPDEDIVRIHSSSGTTGKPVIIPYPAASPSPSTDEGRLRWTAATFLTRCDSSSAAASESANW